MLEKELDNRKAEVNRLDNELRKEHGVRMRLGQELEEKSGLVRKRESGIRAVSADLLKANEIIKKLQDQVRQEHARAKLTARALEEQEGIVAAKEAELEAARIDIRTSSEAATDAKAAAEEAEASAERLRAEVTNSLL